MSSSNARRPARYQTLLFVVGISIGIVSLVALSTSHSNSAVTTVEIHQLRMAEYVRDRGLSKATVVEPSLANDADQTPPIETDEDHAPINQPASDTDSSASLSSPTIVVPHLDCTPFENDGTSDSSSAYAQEMVYWRDIQDDETHNPFLLDQSAATKYMTFEPDGGGWNNIRMAMETVVALAIATGRTLVLPPEQRMYLLAKNRGKMKTDFGFHDFFTVKDWKHSGVDIITMQEFLERTAMKGEMRYKSNGTIAFPPDNNRTDWNGKDVKVLKTWLREVEQTVHWQPGQCLAVFGKESTDFEGMLDGIISKGQVLKDNYLDTLLPMNAETSLRLRENLAKRSSVCRYNTTLQQAPSLHFMCSHKDKVRLLVHFYAFVFFDDWKADLWMKRFVRDHVRYVDEIQCAAARIIRELRKKSPTGIYDALHVRRGDFQYKHTRIEADEILANINSTIPANTTLYIATDERDKNFFKALKGNYNVFFMDDFKESLGPDVNHNFYGMIDQLVASRSRTFFGCWHSTFTGYIMRLRGYHNTHPDGLLLDSYYYVPVNSARSMHRYAPLQGAFFNREFPTAWRQLDFGVGEPDPGIATMR